nr:MAG TPA: hypothetical protein [Herelleviridae sp.]
MKLSQIGLIDGGLLLGFYASDTQIDIYLIFVLIRFERN